MASDHGDPGESQLGASFMTTHATSFHEALQHFESYPDNLPPGIERRKFLDDIKRHFSKTKGKILLVPKAGARIYRRTAILRKIRLKFYDYGGRQSSANVAGNETEAAAEGSSARRWSDCVSQDGELLIKTLVGLKKKLGLLDNDEKETDGPPADPVCRLIFLETLAPLGRRLKITEEMLFHILTYHHVSPCFLNLISYFGRSPLTRDSDLLFGGFRSLKSFSAGRAISVEELGRSGLHYQLAFELKTVFEPRVGEFGDGEEDDEYRGGPTNLAQWEHQAWWRRLLPSWAGGKRSGDTSDEDETDPSDLNPEADEDKLWPVMQTAVYHHFDVKNGNSLWIMTAMEGDEGEGVRAENIQGIIPRIADEVSATSTTEERFRICSLEPILWLMEWSLSDYALYIADLDDSLELWTKPLSTGLGESVSYVHEKALKIISRYIEQLDECIVGLRANIRMHNALLKFYQGLLEDSKLQALKLPLFAKESNVSDDIEAFSENLRNICAAANQMLARAEMVKEMGSRREDTIQRVIQNRNEQTMKQLAEVTFHDSTTMRIFATITLILLPMSVVSTLFTTDIVKFQGIGSFAGAWSGAAAVWWTGATLLATVIVYLGGEHWRRKAIDRVNGGGGRGRQRASRRKHRKFPPIPWPRKRSPRRRSPPSPSRVGTQDSAVRALALPFPRAVTWVREVWAGGSPAGGPEPVQLGTVGGAAQGGSTGPVRSTTRNKQGDGPARIVVPGVTVVSANGQDEPGSPVTPMTPTPQYFTRLNDLERGGDVGGKSTAR